MVLRVTGWQSGDQGGWNQNQPFGPEAQTSKYGTDPYASPDPYGADPYGNQYGADPYGGGYDQYGQQQYPPTGGFPAPGYPPPPPPEPKRSKLPMILSLIAIVIIVGAVVAIVLVNRKDGQPVADPGQTTSQKPPSPQSKSSGPSTSASGGGNRDDWLSIDNSAKSGLSYQVPPDWKQTSEPQPSGLKVDFSGVAEYGTYDCEGSNYWRSLAASGDVQGSGGKDLDLATTMEDFTNSFARQSYGEAVRVEVVAPTETKVGDKTAMKLTAKVTTNATGNCVASEAEVAMVGVEVQEEGKPKGVAMLVVVSDVTGGPADPKPLDSSVPQEILSTVSAR